eukprot:1818391-Rhodomonas_salina.1
MDEMAQLSPLPSANSFSPPFTAAMASEETHSLVHSTSANGGVSAAECGLFLLPPAVVGQLWPAGQLVVGLRVCKQLRRDLLVHCSSIVLVQKNGERLSDCRISEDFERMPQNLKLKWNQRFLPRDQLLRLLEVLGECKALAVLDLSDSLIGVKGAGVLAGVLRECKALAHLNLRWNEIGVEGADEGGRGSGRMQGAGSS